MNTGDTIYMVQKIDGYGGWGEIYYGDVIEVFKTKEDALDYCYEHNLVSSMTSWPTITITERKIK